MDYRERQNTVIIDGEEKVFFKLGQQKSPFKMINSDKLENIDALEILATKMMMNITMYQRNFMVTSSTYRL